MKILFDQGTPAPLRKTLAPHFVSTAFELGWAELENGDLLAAAEKVFDAFITTDKNLRYQQNLSGRQLAILVLPTTNWPEIQKHLGPVADAVNALRPGDFID
jgi:predicted nuclease of predicted toxin-antitoxin system